MWEDRETRRYVAPQVTPGDQPHSSHGHRGNNGPHDPTEDLHAWSIYRQNLNADLSESAIGMSAKHQMPADSKPFGNFQLKESTVHNILSHPKYGPSIKNHDPYTYLRFGLPRVKPSSQSEIGLREQQTNNGMSGGGRALGGALSVNGKYNYNQQTRDGRGMASKHVAASSHRGLTSDSTASASDEDEDVSPYSKRRRKKLFGGGDFGQHQHEMAMAAGNNTNNKRSWKSQPDLVNVAESNFIIESKHHQPTSVHHPKPGHQMNGNSNITMRPTSRTTGNGVHSKALSEVDLTRQTMNGHTNGHVNNGYISGFDMKTNGPSSINGMSSTSSKLPHLIVRNLYQEVDETSFARKICGSQRQKLRLLDNLNFDVKSGEILAILATNVAEGTAILDVLGNRFDKSKCKVKGDFILNGAFLTPSKLSQYISYVGKDINLCPEITTRQALLFSTLVQKSARRNDFDTKKRINALLEELGLSEVRHSSISSLTNSEKKRLMIAIALLLDNDIVILDEPIKGMDIFDSFFLIEYLRQWTLISGKIIIMTIHPATYEIFTMLTKTLLVSTGRTIFFGKRKDMLSYFSYIDYPCPAFKNPSDYYLDLVTLDNLSNEAMLESSQRIENLIEMYHRRYGSANMSMPSLPSPASLPPQPKKAGFVMQFLSLWIRALIFTFPYNVIHMFSMIFIALIISILTGIIYWHVRAGREQEHMWDRIGFYHAMLAVTPIPLLASIISDFHQEKQFVLSEVKHGFYGKAAYFFSKSVYSLLSATLAFIAFSLPASSMAGLHNDLSLYLLLMVTYLHVLRIIAITCSWYFDTKLSASVFFGFIYSLLILGSGTSIHYKDLSMVTKWLHNISPLRYIHESLIGWEFSSNVTLALATTSWTPSNLPYLCSHNPIIQQENAILIKADCGFQSRANVLSWFNYKGSSPDLPLRSFSHPFISSGAVFITFLLLALISWMCFSRRKRTNYKCNPSGASASST